MYTRLYLDFDEEQWKQISSNPATFQCIADNVSLEIMDTSQNSKQLQFKNGGKLSLVKVIGKYRITWNDEDVIKP